MPPTTPGTPQPLTISTEVDTVKTLIAHGAAMSREPVYLSKHYPATFLVPNGFSIGTVTPTHDPRFPVTTVGHVKVDDAASFIAYVRRHATPLTVIYAKQEPMGFIAVLDDHPANDDRAKEGNGGYLPQNRAHRVSYACPLSPEWRTWLANNGKSMKQEDFADFIEANRQDVAAPMAAELIEMAITMRATTDKIFERRVDRQSGGIVMNYKDDPVLTAGRSSVTGPGTLMIPETIFVQIPILMNSAAVSIECRLRFKIDEKSLLLRYEMIRPHVALSQAFHSVLGSIAGQVEDINVPVLLGSPE